MNNDNGAGVGADGINGEDKAKQRFILINIMRFAGVIMILLGIAISQGLYDLPMWTAILLVVLGMIEAFVTPQILARMWRTKNPSEREHDGTR